MTENNTESNVIKSSENIIDESIDTRCNDSCVEIIEDDTLCGCPNKPINPIPNALDAAVAKIPVVLAELRVRFNVISDFRLPEKINDIKFIKKHLRITEAMLIGNTNVLFVKGFIRKNIVYGLDEKCDNKNSYCGNIEHCTIDIPFRFTTDITKYITQPADIVKNTREEFQFLREGKLPKEDFPEKDRLLSGDFTEFNQESTEYFNELPYVEIVSSRIVEYDEFINRDYTRKPLRTIEFDRIEQKMVVYLTLKVLQKRQVRIGNLNPVTTCEDC